MQTKKILNDKEKVLIAFGNNKPDCYAENLKIPCNCVFFNDLNLNNLIDNIIRTIKTADCKT